MIKLQNITAGYLGKPVLRGVSLDFVSGEFTFILGQNGAGKSTLLRCINGILRVEGGEVLVESRKAKVENRGHSPQPPSAETKLFSTTNGETLASPPPPLPPPDCAGRAISDWEERALAREIAFIPQEFYMQFDYTVWEFVLMGRYAWLDFWGNYTAVDYEIAEKYLAKLGLLEFKDRYFNKLSGGEKQRVLIARALVQDTSYILMDESLSYLDINHQIEILCLLRQINDNEGKTIIMVSHNLNLASEFADRIIVLKKGEVLATGKAEDVFTSEVLGEAFEMEVNMIVNPFTGKRNVVYKS